MQSSKLWVSRLASLLPTVLEKNETMEPEGLLHPMSEVCPGTMESRRCLAPV
jgi:hypothetical protein